MTRTVFSKEPPPPTSVCKAIILVADSGKCLSSFTDHAPKCLAPVNGVPILVNALTHSCDSGIQETVIVVGHLKENIYDAIGNSFNGMNISYIESDRYETTNNIYSLWLAREHLTEDIVLLESDVFFERLLLDRLLSYESHNIAAVARYQSWMSGTVVSLDKDGIVDIAPARFTEFYALGPEGKASGYPRELMVGEETVVILGVVNKEYAED